MSSPYGRQSVDWLYNSLMKLGNGVGREPSPGPVTYTYAGTSDVDPDAVTQIANGLATTTFQVDNDGNVVQKLTDGVLTTHQWDYANRLIDLCSTFELTQQFLREHIEQFIYNRSKVTLLGSVPVQRGTYQSAAPVPFRIEGELDRKAIRARPHTLQPDDGRWKKLQETTTERLPAVAKETALSSF